MEKYDLPMDLNESFVPGKMMRRIRKNSLVLEFGCAYGRMTRYLKESCQCRVWIAEIDPEAFQVAMQYAEDGYCGDVETQDWYEQFKDLKFDYILFADVLEHLRDPERVLSLAGRLLKENGEILLSVPNIGHNDVLAKLFLNRFDYTPLGLLDDTHIHFWGIENLWELAQKSGLSIRVLDGTYQHPYETEQRPDREKLPKAFTDVMACRPYNEVYQFFLVLQKKEWMQKNGYTTESCLRKIGDSITVYVYWDTGAGYQSGQYTQLAPELMEDGRFRFYCDSIPEGCVRVRFDPPLNYMCLLSDVHAITDLRSCEIYPLNGVQVRGMSLFATTNPQMEFDLPAGARWFEVTARMRLFSGAEISELFTELQTAPAREQRLAESEAQREALKQEQNRMEALAEQNAQLLQAGEELAQSVQKLREEKETQAQRLSYLENQAEDLQKNIEQLKLEHEEKCRNLGEQLEEDQARETLLRGMIHTRNLEIISLRQQNQQLEASCGQLRVNADQLRDQYARLINSQSWKITKPIRATLELVKRTKAGQLLYRSIRSAREAGSATGNEQKHAAPMELPKPAADPQNMEQLLELLTQLGGRAVNPDVLLGEENAGKEKCLLVSHEMNLTGAPIALGYFADSVKRKGQLPVVMSPRDGALTEQMCSEGIPVVIFEGIYQSDFVAKCAKLFSYIVVNTIVGAPIIQTLNGVQTPVLWWIHEAQASYYPEALAQMPQKLEENIHVFCVGRYAKKILKQHCPSYQVRNLLYFVPDYAQRPIAKMEGLLPNANGKTVFAIVGVHEERKAQDILVQAIRMLPAEHRRKCLFVFVGKPFFAPIDQMIQEALLDYPLSVQCIEELSRDAITSLYAQIDCLICTSKDDPMPIVVTEAMLMRKAVICSENTGSADILEQVNGGLIFHNNDPAELMNCIEFVRMNKGPNLRDMCERARGAYELYFTQEVFDQNITGIVDRLVNPEQAMIPYDGTVSVVIPTFNAGTEVKRLIQVLQNQENVARVEIVIVDSESRDGTADLAESLGARVIRIKQAEFSHSYARNLGAQHATGDYLLFMTQDAFPNGTRWIAGLMQPVLRENVTAVSCLERARPECDLLGRVAIWIHAEYMGILETDRIMKLPKNQSHDSIRRNGQLNDVTCLVNRERFLQFLYRGDYAEDLDLGIRLIRAGDKLALLSSVQVIHSHTRPAFYHLKRTLVDVKTMKRILPNMPVEQLDAQTAANRIVTVYCAMNLLLEDPDAYRSVTSWEELCRKVSAKAEEVIALLQNMSRSDLWTTMQIWHPWHEKSVQNFVEEVYQAYQDRLKMDPALVRSVVFYLNNVVTRYLRNNEIEFCYDLVDEALEAITKYCGQMLGMPVAAYLISNPGEQSALSDMAAKYSTGV